MKSSKKVSAIILVGMLMTTGLVAFLSAPVSAHTPIGSVPYRFQVDYDTAAMSAEMVYDRDGADESYFLLGEQSDATQNRVATANTLTVNITCLNNWFTWYDAGPAVNIYIIDLHLNITNDVTGFDFQDSNTNILAPQIQPTTGSPWPAPTNASHSFTWTFDILTTAGLGPSVLIPMTMWWNVNNTPQSLTFNVQIYISSIFDNPGTEGHELLPDVQDATGGGDDVRFEAGDVFEAGTITLHNYDDNGITDLECWLTAPSNSGITLRFNRAWLPNGIANGVNGVCNYRVDVASRTLPGIYHGTAAINYTRQDNNVRITEPVTASIEFEVDYNFRDTDPLPTFHPDGVTETNESNEQCYASAVAIIAEEANTTKQDNPPYTKVTMEQSTFSDKKIRIRVNITNNGNSDLNRVTYRLNVEDPAWDYFRDPMVYYSYSSGPAVLMDPISIMFDTHIIGEVKSFEFEVIVAKEIPIGEHRLPIIYDGFYFNNGTLGEPTDMAFVNGVDGVPNGINDLELVFAIVVTDGQLNCHVTTVTAAADLDKDDIRSEVITVNVQNDEQYAFIDILATADFTGTPFYAPLIDTATGQPPAPASRNHVIQAQNAYVQDPLDAWAEGGVIGLEFRVDTDPTMVPDRYPFSLTITAIIRNTLVEVTTTVIAGAEFDFEGYGPEIVITAFTADDIVPGEHFDLALTIQNLGDDAARDLWVSIPSDGTDEYPWTVEADFKDQFDWSSVYSNWFEVTGPIDIPDDMFYTVESLDVDNIREIIEINLYMEGVYSEPGSTIEVIKITDLEPGATTTCTFDMIADKDMVNGKPYTIDVSVEGINPDGTDNIGPVFYDSGTQTIEVMSSVAGDSYNPVELNWFGAGMKLMGLFLFFVIVIVILLIVYNKFKGSPKKEEEEEFGFEDEKPKTP
jgi:hypothetical protein